MQLASRGAVSPCAVRRAPKRKGEAGRWFIVPRYSGPRFDQHQPSFLPPPLSQLEVGATMSNPTPSASSSSSSSKSTPLQFTPLPTVISPNFWHAVTTLKLDHLRLKDDVVPLTARYGLGRTVKDRKTGGAVAIGGGLVLDEQSLAGLQPG